MPQKYYFHLVDKDHVVRDEKGVELAELSAAHAFGVRLQRQICKYVPDLNCNWTVRVAYESGAVPLVILPPRQHTFFEPYWPTLR